MDLLPEGIALPLKQACDLETYSVEGRAELFDAQPDPFQLPPDAADGPADSSPPGSAVRDSWLKMGKLPRFLVHLPMRRRRISPVGVDEVLTWKRFRAEAWRDDSSRAARPNYMTMFGRARLPVGPRGWIRPDSPLASCRTPLPGIWRFLNLPPSERASTLDASFQTVIAANRGMAMSRL